jgi:peptidoglycan/xylan/chitin deacetylase (PgdA/CDA1 family)
MTWSQVIAADRLGFTIGAHTMNHVALARIARPQARAEMWQSKATLEQMVGHPVIEFAYPYGSFNAYLAGQARAMGFESAASTMPGSWHEPGALWWLHRQRVSGWTTLAAFAGLVGGPWPGAPAAPAAPAAPVAPVAPTAPVVTPPQPKPQPKPQPTPAPISPKRIYTPVQATTVRTVPSKPKASLGYWPRSPRN